MSVRHLFAGNNTPGGFFSYYDSLRPLDARRIFLIKGGPGTGKSTFMRGIGEAFAGRELAVEFCHCSSDPDSLDGVVIRQAGVAVLDGTAPHVLDPRFPGAVEEIVNLGAFWDAGMLSASRAEIVSLTQEIGDVFTRAYRYLAAAGQMREELAALYSSAMDFFSARETLAKALDWLLEPGTAGAPLSGTAPGGRREGRVRRLFATAVTPKGPVSFLDNLFAPARRRIILQGAPGTGKSTLVERLLDRLLEKGYDCDVFYDALRPTRPEHLWIAELEAAVITSTAVHPYREQPGDLVLNFDAGLDRALLAARSAELETTHRFFQQLFSQALATLARAKTLHDRLEQYYVASMNFSAVGRLRDEIIARTTAFVSSP